MIQALEDVKSFVIDAGLYSERSTIDQFKNLTKLRFAKFHIDVHCISCKRESIFWATESVKSPLSSQVLEPGYFQRTFVCSRSAGHVYRQYYLFHADVLTKIGQYPSYEAIASADIAEFKPVLPAADYRELHRAGGLNAHGVGIGAFVYLRRIFERLITRHKPTDAEIAGWTTMRMDDKIKALEAVLPPIMVKHRSMYGILSKGIHELDDQECLDQFPIVRQGVILMLRQDLEAKKRTDAEAEFAKGIQAIQQKGGSGIVPDAAPGLDDD